MYVCVCLLKKLGSKKWERIEDRKSVCVCVCVCLLKKTGLKKWERIEDRVCVCVYYGKRKKKMCERVYVCVHAIDMCIEFFPANKIYYCAGCLIRQ